jgi:hypothetical protein
MFRALFWLSLLGALHSHPNPDNLRLPDLDVSTPEEVNSLERDEPLVRSIDPQSSKNNNIEDTVKEVEEIIKSNPALPRLTRGEILDLLENITNVDEQKAKILGKNRDPKAIMVVMPYTPTNDKNMEDLYTKAPVTHIIGAEPFKTKEEANKVKHSRRRPPVQLNDTDNDLAKKPLPAEEKKKYSASIPDKITKPPISERVPVRRKRPEATTEWTPTTYRPSTEPRTYHPKTRRPIRRRTTTLATTQHPNHRYPEEFLPSDGIKIIESPKLAATVHDSFSSDLDLQENTRQEVVMNQRVPVSASFVTTKPTTFNLPTAKPTTAKPVIEEINLPDSLKSVVNDLNLRTVLDSKNEKLVGALEEQNRIKNILASIGGFPVTTTTTAKTTMLPNAENVAESLSPDMRELLMSFGLLPNPNQKPATVGTDTFYPERAEVRPESYIGFKPLPDDGPSREDMDALLASFGLGRSARKEKAIKVNDNTKQQSYNFDMIPEHLKGVVADLGISDIQREEKKIRTSMMEKTAEKQHVFKPDTQREEKKIRTSVVEKTAEKQHVFNPDTQYASEEELKKLEQLIGMIKQLENINGTADDLKKIDLDSLKELVSSLNGSNNETFVTLDEKDIGSPDPNNFDFGVSKNEVKRQESTTASSTTTTSSSTTVGTASESETPSIADLEASFGGQAEAMTQPPVPETTTKRTGFYYLVDWNTFLDIDDTKGKRVNLRFQPTIGDPRRFLSV